MFVRLQLYYINFNLIGPSNALAEQEKFKGYGSPTKPLLSTPVKETISSYPQNSKGHPIVYLYAKHAIETFSHENGVC